MVPGEYAGKSPDLEYEMSPVPHPNDYLKVVVPGPMKQDLNNHLHYCGIHSG
jgi:hypothetical protein